MIQHPIHESTSGHPRPPMAAVPSLPSIANSVRLLVDARGGAEVLNVSLRHFHTLRKRQDFPESIILGVTSVRWRLSDLTTWVDGLATSPKSRPLPPQVQAAVEARKARKAAAAADPLTQGTDTARKPRRDSAVRKAPIVRKPLVVDGLAGFQFPGPESQDQHGSQQSVAPSNRISGHAAG